jgi:hypothetical protein
MAQGTWAFDKSQDYSYSGQKKKRDGDEWPRRPKLSSQVERVPYYCMYSAVREVLYHYSYRTALNLEPRLVNAVSLFFFIFFS